MKLKVKKQEGFTLIELLVVITIIGILAGIALPVYGTIQERGNQTKALAQAKQIGLALKLFAGDNDGNYPQNATEVGGNVTPDFATAPTDANIAYKQLIPDYVSQEKIFYVAKSKFSPNPPDEKTDTWADRLKAGENHWAYVSQLSDTSNPSFPLIADGFADAAAHKYSADETAKGGVWKGKKAIIIRVDQSGAVETVKADLTVTGKRGQAGDGDIFQTGQTGWLSATQVVKNPAE